MQRLSIIFILCILSSGCSYLPQELDVAKSVELLPFDEVGDMDLEPTNYQALWGGVITKTVNYTDRTRLEVVYFPLNDSGEPQVDGESLGRFRIYVGGFIDPFVYRPGRMVTVLGTLGVREKGYVGHFTYEYTVLHSIELHLWEDKEPIPVSPYLATPPSFESQEVFSYQ